MPVSLVMKTRGTEMPQRQSPRGPLHLRTSSSDSDPLHHRHATDRSPKVGDRRSPRRVQPDPLNQKKFGTRIADLESQLGQAQEELKNLKEQLATAEAAKKEAQQELGKKIEKPALQDPVLIKEKPPPSKIQASSKEDGNETEVFEVPLGTVSVLEPSLEGLALKKDEINLLKASVEEKEKNLELSVQENEGLKKKLTEAALEISSVRANENEMVLRLGQMGEELEGSKANAAQLHEKLKAVEKEKEELGEEMKRLRVQTDQWRKAADAAAAVLAEGAEGDGRISDRCSSMNKQFGGLFYAPAGSYAGFAGSPGVGDDSGDDGFGGAKRKSGGMRMFGELWKRKGHK